MYTPRARVFISCGQRSPAGKSEIGERIIAEQIEKKIGNLEFEPYLAAKRHTYMGPMDDIFRALEASEYFIFVDFRREKLGCNFGKRWSRGSIYSHQELAIASFLKTEQLRFAEEGVRLEGIGENLHGRPVPFADRSKLPELVEHEVRDRLGRSLDRGGWRTDWKNALTILDKVENDPHVRRAAAPDNRSYSNTNQQLPILSGFSDAPDGGATFWHLVVRNLHCRRLATDCRCFLKRCVKISGTDLPTLAHEHVEQKWAGVVYNQSVAIPANNGERRVAAFHKEDQESGIHFHQMWVDTDSAKAAELITGPGKYELEYLVVSSNFPTASKTFVLELDRSGNVQRFAPSDTLASDS
ncbi:MAG TPA: hypothetical protein VJZ71_03295 [Phycisphaerae bacterium]|nr:hypothetical protein [Phycisphaerae bacterium]